MCLLKEDVFERQGLIEYNFHCFREAIQEVRLLEASQREDWLGDECVHFCPQVFELRRKALQSSVATPSTRDMH